MSNFRSYLEDLFLTAWRKRSEEKRITCSHPDYLDAYVVLPPEWLGSHAVRRTEVLQALGDRATGAPEIANLAVAMSVIDDWGGIPGIEDKDPEKWNLQKTPLYLINWISEAVLEDFGGAFRVPKNSFAPLMTGSTATQTQAGSMDPDPSM